MRDGLVRLWDRVPHEHRELAAQLMRYGVVGVGVTLFQIAIFNLALGAGHMAPLIANTVATAAAMLIGYTVHSRFTFEGHGSGGSAARTGGKFLAANMVGFAANSLWVWLFSAVLRWSPHWASLPVFFVTPALLFWLNRKWVFD
ncbi:GtrA family protein [uncultured Sphingomonas sp.]|uniref:GtrA family protein n=1 Tax=uncultured Sphingomonas sp. TaxID=158754 RepID=UPI00260D7601|nr:GtrA family protein [uncultured Sphingomonas sp.]